MYLGVMAQRLKVAHALHGIGDGLPVHDAPRVKAYVQVKALLDKASQYLRLHPAHKLHGDIPCPLVPQDMKLRVLLLKLHQLRQQRRRVRAGGQTHTVAQ